MSSPTPTPTPCVTFTDQQIADRYGFPDNLGEGTTVGILAWGNVGDIGVDTDQVIAKIQKTHPSYNPNYQFTYIGGQSNNNSTGGELSMDCIIMGTYVPSASAINIYIATWDTIPAAIQKAADDGCWVTTCSFAVRPLDTPSKTQALMHEIDDALKNAVATGMTACFASGDSGAGSGKDGVDDVAWPAGSASALAVGGTFVPQATDIESVWWNYPKPGGNAHRSWWGSGGGVSTFEPIPGYQTALTPTQPWSPEHAGRGVPDVACMAQGNSGWVGTSCACPTFASLLARIGSDLGQKLGDVHDAIYNMPSTSGAFTSITTGDNVPPTGQKSAGNGYQAASGWDMCTGWGTPNGAALKALLSQSLGLSDKP